MSQTRRIGVIGDVGGHLDQLRGELVRLGADPGTGRLPPDLRIIQVGDLVHRGPDSEGVVALVDDYLRNQPDQWLQLVGNHEAQYLREPAFEWPTRIEAPAVDTLRRWWADGRMQVAAAIQTVDGESFVVTHAGITAGFWREVLDAPASPVLAAAALNSFIGTHEAVLFRAGHMLNGGPGRDLADECAGPVWAAAATELVPSWLGTRLPFSQVHGHTSIIDWHRRVVRTTREIGELTTVDEAAKHATVTLDGGRIVGVDPGHGREPNRPWQALVLPV